MRRSRSLLTLLALAATVAVGCGIPLDESARPIDPETVEYDLLATTTSTTSTTVVETPSLFLNLYWHNAVDGRLEIVQKGRDTLPSPQDALLELVAGPLEADLELNPDLQTLLDDTMAPEISDADENGLVRIMINRAATEALDTDQAAEFVCTVTQYGAIEQVEIVDPEEQPFSLSGFGAVTLTGPARASDFGDCEAEPDPTLETTTEEADDGTTTEGADDGTTPTTSG